jgi:hypothetical protein
MNNSNNNVDKQYLLDIPMAYLLQNKDISEIEKDFDNNGWNILHYAIADADLGKMVELLHFDFDWNLQSKSNFIPSNIYKFYDKKRHLDIKKMERIPFCDNGFTPLHLLMFLFNFYSHASDDFGHYTSIISNYRYILEIFFEEKSSWVEYIDSNGHSLLDYAFLLENLDLINSIQKFDPTFSNLKKVSSPVAKKIIEIMQLKLIKHEKNKYSKVDVISVKSSLNEIKELLEKKVINDSLKVELNINFHPKKAIQKI